MGRIVAFMLVMTFAALAVLYSDSKPVCDGIATHHFDYRPCEDFAAGGAR